MAQSSVRSARRGPGRPFPKGQSGNPGGRPKKLAEVQAAAAEHTVKAISTLSAILDTGSGSERIAAARTLLEWAWGSPSQPVEIHEAPTPARHHKFEEDIRRILALKSESDRHGGEDSAGAMARDGGSD